MKVRIRQDFNIPIGKNIREARLRQGMMQKELVIEIQFFDPEMTRERLSKIERGVRNPTATELRIIRDVLNTTYDELLREQEESRE